MRNYLHTRCSCVLLRGAITVSRFLLVAARALHTHELFGASNLKDTFP